MSVKKVSSEVAFITEPRTDFTRAAKPSERNVTLGSWPASSIVLARKWVDPDEATVEVEMPADAAFAIFPQRSDSSVRERARYVSIPTPVGQRRVFLIDQVDLQELDAEHVKASIKALSPEAWLSQVPSTIAGADQTFEGRPSAAPFLAMLYESTVGGRNGAYPCTETVQGVQYRALPITATGTEGFYESQLAYYGIQDPHFDPSHSPSDSKPTATADDSLAKPGFPAPIGETVFKLLKSYPYQISMQDGVEGVEYRSEFEACLVPVPSPYDDDCLWWTWLFHQKQAEPIWISRQAGTADGEATLHLTTGKTDAIAWIADSVEGSAGKAATASFPGKPRYAGPWASVEAKEVSEGQGLGKADAAREAAAALAGLQAVVTIDATANAGSDTIDAIKLRPGTLAGVRFGKQAFTFPINEVDYSFSVDRGWEIKAPVSVETNSIDYRYPWWQEEGGEDPVPPEATKAGLKQLFGGGWRGSIAQDLHGEWWVLGSTGKYYSIGEPVAAKIDELELSAEAELIALTNAQTSQAGTKNWLALFNDADRVLAVSTGIAKDGDATTITPVVSEVTLDAPVVSAPETTAAGIFTVVTEAGSVYTVTVNAAGEPSAQKMNTAAGLFKPTTFLPGAADGSLLAASGSYCTRLTGGESQLLEALQPGETVIANPFETIVITSQRVLGLKSTAAATAVEEHGGAVNGWLDSRNKWHLGCFIACHDGSLLRLNSSENWGTAVVAAPPSEGAEWRGVLTTDGASYAIAWGSEGVVRLEESGGSWQQTVVDSSPVLALDGFTAPAENAGHTCWVTEAGELKTSGVGAVKTVDGLTITPKRCWSSYPTATQTGNVGVILKGQILVAGDGNDAALLTQSTLVGEYSEEQLSLSSPIAEVVKPLYGSFFVRLEDGSLVNEQGKNILEGSEAEGAHAFSIAEDSRTGCCWLATDRGAYRAAATHDSIFMKPAVSQPAVGQVEKLEGTWGELRLVSSGVMAGPEEAHFGHGPSAVRLAELTSPAVEAVPAGDQGCFVLTEDGSVCLQPDVDTAFWRVAEPPDGWKPEHLFRLDSAKVLAWSEDGHSESVAIEYYQLTGTTAVSKSTVTEITQLAGGLGDLQFDHYRSAWGLSGGSLFKLGGSSWEQQGSATGLTGFSVWDRQPTLLQQGSNWYREVDGALTQVSGLSGELVSRVEAQVSTTGGTVDFSACKQRWSEEDGRYVEVKQEPAVVSTDGSRLLGNGRLVKSSGGLYSITSTSNKAPDDNSEYYPQTYSLELQDGSVSAATCWSTNGDYREWAWLCSRGLTNGDWTIVPELSSQIDAERTAELAQYHGVNAGYGFLAALKNGKVGWVSTAGIAEYSSMQAEDCLGLFGSTSRDRQSLLAASTSAVSAAWRGAPLQESPLLLTAEPRGLRGEELTPVVWGRYGLSRWGEGRWHATWPATAGLGAVTEARVVSIGAGGWAVAACEHGLVAPPTYSSDELQSWQADGLHFSSSGYRQPDDGQIAVIRNADGQLWFFYHVLGRVFLVKTTMNDVVADVASTAGRPITVATSEGLTTLTLKTDGTYTAEPVEGSLPATTAYKRLASDSVIAYDSETGDLQALVQYNVASQTLLKAAEPTETGLTAIRGEGTNNADNWLSAPLIYGEQGVVAVSLKDGKLTGESWSEKLSKLGFPGAEDSGSELPIL